MTMEIPILGGNPASEMQIDQKDIRDNRSGLKAFQKLVAGGNI